MRQIYAFPIVRFFFLSLIGLVVACGGRATETHRKRGEDGPRDLPSPATGGTRDDVALPREGTGGDSLAEGGASSDDEPSLDDVTRTSVSGCSTEALLGECPGLEKIVVTELAWSIDDEGKLVVSGIAGGDASDYPCIGLSPAHADDDAALGVETGASSHAISQLFAVSDDFPTPITMSLSPEAPGDYQVVVWVSRLEHDCAAPVEVLNVKWE